MKIGILGGTFDPPHNAHLEIAKRAIKQFDLDKVIFIPSGNPWQKKDATPFIHRYEMTKILIERSNKFEISDVEKSEDVPSYTVDTLTKLNHKKDNLYFIHKFPHLIDNSINFFNDLHWGGDFKKIIEMINKMKIDNSSIKFFSGYSGWTYNQLIAEVNNGSWVIVKNKANCIFKRDIKKMWGEKMKKMDEKFKIWSNAPENPQDN